MLFMIPNPEISRISLTALRFRDSPEDVLPRPSTPPRETAVSFGGLPFHPAAIPVAFTRGYLCRPHLYHAVFNYDADQSVGSL